MYLMEGLPAEDPERRWIVAGTLREQIIFWKKQFYDDPNNHPGQSEDDSVYWVTVIEPYRPGSTSVDDLNFSEWGIKQGRRKLPR